MLRRRFKDTYPGAPRILFVGRADSVHTRSWIGLLEGERFNVRLFSPPSSAPPPDDFAVPTYVTTSKHSQSASPLRSYLVSGSADLAMAQRFYASRIYKGGYRRYSQRWLAEIIRSWKPDIIHTQSVIGGGLYYSETRRAFALEGHGVWVLQLWGGADLWYERTQPERRVTLDAMLRDCDQLFDDNRQGLEYAIGAGCRSEQLATLGLVPGNGGIDLDALVDQPRSAPSTRRMIVWPKAYDTPWSRPLPILEALRIAWPRLGEATVNVLAASEEIRSWIARLPEEMRGHIHVHDMVPHATVMRLFSEARVVLAPSLVDGVPNVMLEAMAAGALPIVSPLDPIMAMVEHEKNVLLARNLYPDDLADALVRGMSDDGLVDRAADANLPIVRAFADRALIRPRVITYYRSLIRRVTR